MTQETETLLRKSLDAVDRNRRRLTWVLAVAGLMVGWEFYRLVMARPTSDVPSLIVEAVIVLSFWTLGLVVVIVFQLTVATKRILRAIELASRTAR